MLTFGTLAVLRWPPCGDKANVTVPGPFFTWPPCGDKANVTVPGPLSLHGLRVAIRRM